ncbi:MAG: baseplate multidomain protein megatron [Alphaproteobacteria bacterium]
MSTLILTTARAAGQTLIATGKRYAKSYVKRRIRTAFDDRVYEGPQLENFHVLGSQDGAPMARLYGRARLAGQVIWASRLKEHVTKERVGGKGGPSRKTYSYTISFAVGLCEGEILGVDRLWVNGAPLAAAGLNFRVYKGTEDQLSDPIISAIEGASAPAFRGTAYMVFEDFPLDEYGARLPQINAEIIRVPPSVQQEPRLEDHITGVNLLPSSGEYAYATDIIEDVSGKAYPVNMNSLGGQADIEQALDQLETQLPQCQNISLIISWFGTDLRMGECEITPGVEARDRIVPDVPWQVCGQTRETAYLVSQDENGRPNYGGTPSDASIVQAIRSFKTRGFKVTIYPFILMDVPTGNGLPDPYGAAEQAAFPWRGRIISPSDMSAGASIDVDGFFGACSPSDFETSGGVVTYSGPSEFSFRRFILHNAKLAALAGGVERFVIGSEMRGLTTTRAAAGVYPAVDKLKALAADVRTVLGSQTGLTYAADWSEYFGHHAGGDVDFHLDSLWSDPNIDAVGIDAYFPLSDWRDGVHLDESFGDSLYDLDYLKANMEGGEGYDWYYASPADRDAQTRTPIADGGAGKPWVFRYKDIRNWWGNPHYNRAGGTEDALPTSWMPESKPIWFTEIGCPAIDKGSNQPNVFVDPKSSESAAPYYSSGTRDDLIQRRYIEAFLSYWQDKNTVSSVYSGAMVDLDAAYIWCWDARPFPDFPARKDVWSDGNNWLVGHWLSGRTGLVPLRDVVRDLALQSGLTDVDVSRVHGMVDGYVAGKPMSVSAALEPLLGLYGVNMAETASGIVFMSEGTERRAALTLSDIVGGSPAWGELTLSDASARPRDVRLHYVDRARDYQVGMCSARGDDHESVHVVDLAVPLVMGEGQAKRLAEALLTKARTQQSVLDFRLSYARMDIEVGDVLQLPSYAGDWRVEAMDGIETPRVLAQQVSSEFFASLSGFTPSAAPSVPWVSAPVLTVLDIADVHGNGERRGGWVGAAAEPFNPITVSGPDGEAVLTAPAIVGALTTVLPRGPIGRWDYGSVCETEIRGADLSAVDDLALLAGENRFAVETETGWEILQAAQIELIGENTYRLSKMLRGLAGTEVDMMDAVPSGARIAYLDQGFVDLPISNDHLGEDIVITAEAGGRDSAPAAMVYAARHLRPLAPVHGRAEMKDGALHVSWARRTRIGGDNWAGLDVPLGEEREFYRVEVLNGEDILLTIETAGENYEFSSGELSDVGTFDGLTIRQGSMSFGFGPSLTLAP